MTWLHICYAGLALLLAALPFVVYAVARQRRWRSAAMAVLLVGFVVAIATAFPASRQEKQHHKIDAQECVDSGGVPYRTSRYGDQTCLYRNDG